MPYGAVTIKDGQGSDLSGVSAILNPFLFTARRFDEETGLYHYRHRAYDPVAGRFLQRDPLGYVDAPNLHAYGSENPLRTRDPLGLQGEEDGQRQDPNEKKLRDRLRELEETYNENTEQERNDLADAREDLNEAGVDTGTVVGAGAAYGASWVTAFAYMNPAGLVLGPASTLLAGLIYVCESDRSAVRSALNKYNRALRRFKAEVNQEWEKYLQGVRNAVAEFEEATGKDIKVEIENHDLDQTAVVH
jgi:RHS repeat-associated protein